MSLYVCVVVVIGARAEQVSLFLGNWAQMLQFTSNRKLYDMSSDHVLRQVIVPVLKGHTGSRSEKTAIVAAVLTSTHSLFSLSLKQLSFA